MNVCNIIHVIKCALLYSGENKVSHTKKLSQKTVSAANLISLFQGTKNQQYLEKSVFLEFLNEFFCDVDVNDL